ncbi:AAA family ATPase [Paenibacillus eucommiae]|uniref:Nuclease SbcCD subunit C n=1 Tax=Paenibacillus eucommiae TaxID=1355755 RepID=A0ABS4IUM1_9BACL|nr:SMC family ATPase [Paenibacillus eucommiae]MBP1990269.1 exonuclease SbcC [Paenibacillus eucommiae]
MRPLKLVMTAFGPFKDREEIDFAVLEDCRLFVISGSTGAGKTTIFDAICFALYGTASGEDRYDSRMLRSHFADEETHTLVELEFGIGRRIYRVVRQLGHRKGNNKTETGAKIELYERIDGQDVPIVERYTVKDVNDKLERIIGLTNSQFSQIVMLPQGEFRRLLTSETENKEEILRRIFRTELYQKVEGQFQQKTKDLKAALQSSQTELEVHVRQIPAVLPARENTSLVRTMEQDYQNVTQIVEGLSEEQAYYEERLAESLLRRTALQAELSGKQTSLHHAKSLNDQFRNLELKRVEKASMDSSLPEHEAREKRLELAEKAVRLEPYEEQWQQALKAEAQRRKEHEAKLSTAATVRREWEAAELRYREETGKEEQRRQADRELQRLQDLAPAVAALHAAEQEVAKLRQEEEQSAAKLASHERQLLGIREERARSSERVKALEQETAALPERKEALGKLREQAKLMKDTLEVQRLIEGYIEQESERQRTLSQMQSRHDKLEQLWIEGQSSLLAAHLHDGQPCPVCGSTSHLGKAEASDVLPTKEELQEVKQVLRLHEQEYSKAQAELAATRTGLADKQTALADFGVSLDGMREQYDGLVREGTRVKEEVERLEAQQKSLLQLKQTAAELELQLDKLTKEKESLSERYQDVRIGRHAKQSMLEKELERIPEELRTEGRLAARLKQQQQLAGQLQQAWKQVQEQYQLLQTRLAEETTSLGHLARQLEEAAAALQLADERFRQELAKAGFASSEVYAQTKLSEAGRSDLRERIEAFAKALAALSQQISSQEQELAGKESADLERLTAELAQAESELEHTSAAHQEFKSRLQDTERLKTNILSVNERLQDQEHKWQQVKDVYDALRGDNTLKLSFERYVLIEFLERILHAANERLRLLSGGQFVLQRSDRLEKHNRQSGLGLDVYDVYTGLNRDVKSMSGGEKFNASLCLALGMSDVIQAYQGGISIEMMFIDEGFGSLDEDALNKAIEALIDLQKSGRMIGVISHVQELKAAFPAILEVRKTKDGHSAANFLLK